MKYASQCEMPAGVKEFIALVSIVELLKIHFFHIMGCLHEKKDLSKDKSVFYFIKVQSRSIDLLIYSKQLSKNNK